MRKITDYIVEKRNIFLIIFVILSCSCLYFSSKVNINDDIMKYLPKDSETKIGYDIMNEEFSKEDTSVLNVMFKDLSDEEKIDTLKKLEEIDGVDSVDYQDNNNYNKKNYTLYVLNVDDYADSSVARDVYKSVDEDFDVAGMSGSIYDNNKPILHISIVILAIVCAMIILIILSESYVEPFLYLITIGMAVFINKGTNIMFSSVSSITDSITAILQLALSMDYSIMLSNRFKQEKENTKDKVQAMKDALYQSFKSISSSSVTTIVGLLALVFMSFTIGRDLGLVLSKGVLLSLICIFICLPSLLLLCDDLIHKTHKKCPQFKLEKLGKFSYKTRWFQTIAIIIIFIGVYFLKGNTTILYTDSEQDKVGKIFPATNQIAVVYENKYEDLISSYCKNLEKDKKIDNVLCYSNTIGEKLKYDELNNKISDLGSDASLDDYLIKLVYYNYFNKGEADSVSLNEFISFINNNIYNDSKFNDLLSDEVKENINILGNFASNDSINKKREVSEFVKILGIDEKDAENILIYYGSKNINNEMTISEFINFMLNDVATDSTYSSSLDSSTISKLKRLQNFTNLDLINKKLNSKELSNMFGIDESLVSQLMLFYRVKSDSTTTLTVNEFASIALGLANNKEYSYMFDEDTIASLKLLQSLSDEKVISTAISSDKMSENLSTIGLGSEEVSLLYNLYNGYNSSSLMTIGEFSNISLGLANDPRFGNLIDKDSIMLLKTLSNESVINNSVDSITMSKMLEGFGVNIDSNKMSLIYTLYNGYNKDIKMTLKDFSNIVLNIPDEYKDIINISDSDKLLLEMITYPDVLIDNQKLYKMFGISDVNTINVLNSILNDKTSPKDFVNLLLSDTFKSNLTEEEITRLEQSRLIMNDSNYYTVDEMCTILNKEKFVVSFIYGLSNNSNISLSLKELINFVYNNPNLSSYIESDKLELVYLITSDVNRGYSINDMANILNKDKLSISLIYGLNNNSDISIKELINFIYVNKDNSLINGYIKDKSDMLNLAYLVTSNTSLKYNYSDISNLIGTDINVVRQVYGLYDYLNYETLLSPNELTDLILNNINDDLLNGKIDSSSLDNLNIVRAVIDNSINNSRLSYNYIGNLLGIDNDTVSLLFSLYDYKYIGTNKNISLYDYVNFIINDVMNNSNFSDKFDNDTKDKLNTINLIMNNSLNNYKYRSLDLYNVLVRLNKDLDKNMVELVCLYNGSINNYDLSWSMTVEEFINYINSDILKDNRFSDFIDSDINKKIIDAKEMIDKSKKLIVSNDYSRAVLNTKYSSEGKETFKFINTLENDLGNNEGVYIVGNSSMANEMSKTFDGELNKITLLTMISIFIVVAITFKSIIIPFILVLIIQCAVYITMSYISIIGGSLYFISLIIVQAILMGATIDYAIVYTSYYKESRQSMSVRDSIVNSYNKSIHTIISSSSILIIVTLIVANFASAIAAKICEAISQGALASVILILLILPGVLAACDKIVCKKE